MNEQRRRHERIGVARPVVVQTSSGMQIRARLVNLSLGGAGIVYSAPAEHGAVLTLRFTIPVAERLVTLSLRSQVRHTHLRTDGHLIGFQFLDISDAETAAVRRFILSVKGMRTQE